MNGLDQFELTFWDYLAFGTFFVVLSGIGYWAGRRERTSADDYFLAGRKLPWYVVGGSFIASNISSEHFIGMIGAAFIYGQCVAMSCWGNVLSLLNQFMVQRVLGAKNAYHARMGIVLAGFTQVFLPTIIVIPGLILFAMHPEVLLLPWKEIPKEADQTFISLVQRLVPIGLRGLVLAGLFGAIQSTVNSVLNSTATIVTLDIYRQLFRPAASSGHLVKVGIATSVIVLLVAIVLAGFIGHLGESLFVYIQTLYAFFAPPFSAVFLLGILWRRINAIGATTAVFAGFALGVAIKLYVGLVPSHPVWMEPYANQAAINWIFCVLVCTAVSLATPRPAPERVTDHLILNWKKLNIFGDLGTRWHNSVVTWWCLFVLLIVTLVVTFSPLVF